MLVFTRKGDTGSQQILMIMHMPWTNVGPVDEEVGVGVGGTVRGGVVPASDVTEHLH